MLAGFFQVSDLEGDMSTMTRSKFIGAVSPWMHLSCTTRFFFADQVYLSISPTEPGTWEVKIARTGDFLHAEYLAVKTSRPLNIFDEQSSMIQAANLHRCVLLRTRHNSMVIYAGLKRGKHILRYKKIFGTLSC